VYGFALVLSILFGLALPTCSPEPIRVVEVAFILSTTSDWTRVTFHNFTLLRPNCSLVSGLEAPGLRFGASANSIWISKRQFDETNVTAKVDALVQIESENVAVLIEKGAIGAASLRIYHEGEELISLTNSGTVSGREDTNPRAFKLSDIVGELEREAFEIRLERILKQPVVLAFYYPWYGYPIGAAFHWGRTTYEDIEASTYYPLCGPYDSTDANLVASHMRLAKTAGVDGFICSWWGIDSYEDRALKRILQVAKSEGFNVTIYYESVREMSKDQILGELTYVVTNYASDASFLKVGGKPVLFIYAPSAYDRDPSFWSDVSQRLESVSNVTLIADTFDLSYGVAFDGFHTYNPIWIGKQDFNRTYASQAVATRLAGKIWAATVAPGYDDRKIRQPSTYVDAEGGEYYNVTWKAALLSDPDMVLICTWNEWHEGTNIEPSREFEFKYLLLTRIWTSVYKKTPLSGPISARPLVELQASLTSGVLNLTIANVRDDDAFAVNVLLLMARAAGSVVDGSVCLPVNDSAICLFIPLLEAGQTRIMTARSASISSDVSLAARAIYCSRFGDKYVSMYARSAPTEPDILLRDLTWFVVFAIVAILSAAAFMGARRLKWAQRSSVA